MVNVGIFYDHSEYFEAIYYDLWPFGMYSLWSFVIFFPFWYVWTKKNLATLHRCLLEKNSGELIPAETIL
jgi:hypothetical protein